MIPLNSRLDGLQRSGIRRYTNLAKTVPGCVMLTIGEPDGDTPEAIKAAALTALFQNHTHYAPNQGLEALRSAIAEAETQRGMVCTPEQVLVTVGLMILAVDLGVTGYSLTPMGEEYRAVIGPILADPNVFTPAGVINWDLLPMDLFLRYTMPIVAVCMALFAALYIFISYRFRLAVYLIMTQPVGAVRAHFLSARLMRGHKWKMLRLDLSWWWYYLLLGAASVVNYLDMILDLMGVPVPLDPVVMFFATLICYCVLFSAICLWKKCRVDASYVLAYEAIANPEPVEEAV